MNELKAPSLNSLLGSDRGSTDSLLAESLLDMEEVSAYEFVAVVVVDKRCFFMLNLVG